VGEQWGGLNIGHLYQILGRQADGQEAAQVRPGLLPGRTVGYRSPTVSACQPATPLVAQ
jgi:hypothetical protein